jgi:serine protease Do
MRPYRLLPVLLIALCCLCLAQPRGGSYLGVRLTDIDPDRAQTLHLPEARGAEIVRVEEDSPAAEAGFKVGDVLLAYNGENVMGAQQLGRLVAETPQGRKVKVQYWRDGKTAVAFIITGAPRAMNFNFPAGPVFDFPGMPDIPSPLLIWKNSMLGFECEPVGPQLAHYFGVKQGALVRSVEDGSPAAKAGLQAGDVITAIGERSVSTPHDVGSYLRGERRTPKSVSLELVREHKSMKLTIPISDRQ